MSQDWKKLSRSQRAPEVFNFLKRLFGKQPGSLQRANGDGPRMSYAPRIASAEPLAKFQVAGREAVLLGNIVSAGNVEYLFILAVYEQDEACFFVASEVNQHQAEFGGGSHFLGVFPGNGHENLGDSDTWADRERFVKQALAIVRERLPAV